MSDRYRYTQARQCSICQKTNGGRRLTSAEVARVEAPQTPKGLGPTRGSGERRELPQRGPGQSPGRKRIFIF